MNWWHFLLFGSGLMAKSSFFFWCKLSQITHHLNRNLVKLCCCSFGSFLPKLLKLSGWVCHIQTSDSTDSLSLVVVKLLAFFHLCFSLSQNTAFFCNYPNKHFKWWYNVVIYPANSFQEMSWCEKVLSWFPVLPMCGSFLLSQFSNNIFVSCGTSNSRTALN